LDSLASFQDDDELRQELILYLGPLLHFARTVLDGKQSYWERYPIYLKATGGLRTLPTPDRIRLINAVRDLFQNKTFNPFEFSDVERARVISGEEEAMYGWAAVNFAIGTLVKDSEGKGEVLNPHRTWGMLEMGGASTQIAWFQNNGDIMANLMKLQIGGARHWNIYAHSFLYFGKGSIPENLFLWIKCYKLNLLSSISLKGVNGAWSRLNARLYQRGKNSSTFNPCLPSKSSFEFESWIHYDDRERPLPRSNPQSVMYNVTMSSPKADFERCSSLTRALLRKEANKDWVDFSHDGDCSFAGVYQPPLPEKNSKDDEFIITSNYYDVWQFLQLPRRARIKDIQDGARRICAMDLVALEEYNSLIVDSPVKEPEELIQYCFRATLTFEMLHTGYGFPEDYEVESADVVNGQKLGWALGSTLYEINTLPWEFGGDYDGIPMPHQKKPEKKHRHSNKKRKHHLFAESFGMANPSDDHDGTVREGKLPEGHQLLAAIIGMAFLLVAWRRTRFGRGRQAYQSV
jgi:GDA1/CD39 (nucleoside phosphatase) family